MVAETAVDPKLATGYQVYVSNFLAFLARIDFSTLPPVSAAAPIAFVLTPWLLTPVPFLSLTIALMVRQRGIPVLLIWDDLTPQANEAETVLENAAIAQVKAALPTHLSGVEWVQCSDLAEVALEAADQVEIERLAQLNAFWFLRTTVVSAEVQQYQAQFARRLAQNLPKIKALFQSLTVPTLLVPGGIYGNSGLFYWCGQQHPVRIASYDVGFSEELWFSVDSVACHLLDIPRAVLAEATLLTPEDRVKAIQVAQHELVQRLEGKDKLKTQLVASSASAESSIWDIVIPLNIDYDSAALGQTGLFSGAYEWLIETLRFILEETQASVVVRQHPTERIMDGNDQMVIDLIERFGGHPRFRFVYFWEQVNSYNLIRNAKLVLPFTSTIGIESVILGKPVVMSRNAYYANLPFVIKAADRADYFEKIRFYVTTEFTPDPEVLETAWLCYFFSQVCYLVQTVFTTYPPDFDRWVQRSFVELCQDPTVNLVLQALIEGTPTITLQYQTVLAQRWTALQQQGIDATQQWQAFKTQFVTKPLVSPRSDSPARPQTPLAQFCADFNAGRTLEALKWLQEQSHQDLQGLNGRYVQAVALARLNRVPEAQALLQTVLQESPDHGQALALLSELHALG